MIKDKNKEFLKNIKNVYCRIKPSKINGVGVFAIKNIPKNINPFQKLTKSKWLKLNINLMKKIDKNVLNMIKGFFAIKKDGTFWAPKGGLNDINISFFMNNSNNPNVNILGDEFKTYRIIKKGEELTINYLDFNE